MNTKLTSAKSKGKPKLPPLTASLFGLLKDKGLSEADYKKHLRKKHL